MNVSPEEPTIRRRNRLRHHYTMISNVVLFGYESLKDPHKLTYIAIDSFDWPDRAGSRKGYAYPSLGKIAELRRVDIRTIERHLVDLERVGLITRELRPGQTSILWIEDPSQAELEAYLSTITTGPDIRVGGTPDTDVRGIKEDESEYRQNHVNGDSSQRTDENRAKRDCLAGEILDQLGDEHSLGFYRKVAFEVNEHKIFEALSEVRLASKEKKIRTSKGALFTALVRQKRRETKM